MPTSELHVVVGAGPVGRAIALLLADAGHRVRVVTRSGAGAEHPGIERRAADASDAATLRELSRGATAIYNAANPPYHRWPELWPPMAASMLGAAEANEAVLSTVSNLYAYGPVDRPIVEDMPLASTETKSRIRAQMWADALAAHEASRVRVVEVRGSDYVGARAQSHLTRAAAPLVAGRTARVLGSADQPHSWTYIGDVARLLAAAAADPTAHGRPWHVPSNAPRTQRQAIADLAESAGLPMVKVTTIPTSVLRLGGVFVPMLREVVPMLYQFTRPFVLDDSAARQHFDLQPTPWAQALAETIADVRG